MDTNHGAYTTQADFDTAVARAQAAATAYYDTAQENLTDGEYDYLVSTIETTLTAHPDWDDQGVTTAVAAGVSAGGDVKHPRPMLSLGKVPTLTDVTDFIRTVGGDIVVEPKMDGLAVRCVYTAGLLTQVVTRGDGQTGEDVTARAANITGLPTKLDGNRQWNIEVRGEIFMSTTDLNSANELRVAHGKTAYVNARNGAAGALRKENPGYIIPMSFAAYDTNGDDLDSHAHYTDRIEELAYMGVGTALHLLPTEARTLTPMSLIAWIKDNRSTLGYPIDGVVLKANNDADRARLGDGNRSPKWAVAYKYEAETATTVINDIEFALGRTGRLSIRARVEPVFVGGANVQFASLHNVGWLIEKDIRIGDTVAIKRANDVIPYVDAPDLSLRPAGSIPWAPPTVCPNCGEAFDKTTELWRCRTPSCSLVGRVTFLAARDCCDIEGMSIAVSTALVETGAVNDIADVFALDMATLANLPMGQTSTGSTRRLGNANAAKIIAQIEKAKAQPFNRVITSLGMRGTGRTMGRRLFSAFPTMDALRDASIPALCGVEGIAEGKAESIFNELRNMASIVDRLAAAGVNMGTTPVPASATATASAPASGAVSLAGKTYVVSGSVPGFTRTTIAEAIENAGGKASSSVSKTTTALVTSETTTSKAVKAAQLGIPVIDPAEFAAMLAG